MSENKDESGIDISDFVEYRIDQFESLEGILLWSLEALMLVMGLLGMSDGRGIVKSFIVPIIGGLGWFLFSTWRFNYVRLSKDYLIIKNKVFINKKIIYENSNIKEVVLSNTSFGKFHNRILTITTKDLKCKSFSCNLFKRRTFFDLKNAMISYGINVKDRMYLTEKDFKTFMHK